MTVVLRYLLDTNVISELTKPVPNAAVQRALLQHDGVWGISAPTLEELTFGCARVPSPVRQAWLRRWIEGLIASVTVLPFDAKAAFWLGQERARLAALGRPAPRTDGEIAAIACTQGLTLVTHNQRDFEAFEGLQLEDWYAA